MGRGRGDGASLLSKQVFHQDAIVCHVCHEPCVTVLSSSLLKLSHGSQHNFFSSFFFFSIPVLIFLSSVNARHAQMCALTLLCKFPLSPSDGESTSVKELWGQ